MKQTKVLVTGGCGYLGSQLIRALGDAASEQPLTVRILDNLQSGDQRALMDLPQNADYEFIEGDILDPSVLRVALKDIDAVVHLAAMVRTPLSFEEPHWVEQVNHWGTTHLVEACLERGVSRFIYASSVAVYGPGGPFDEEDICRPMGTYANSKYAAEQAVLSAADRGLEPVVLRIGTLYGHAPVTRFDAVANKFAYYTGTGRALTVYGDGEQARPYIHVRDAADGIQRFLSHATDIRPTVVNLVSENATVLELVDALRKIQPNVDVRFTEQDIRTHLSFEVSNDKLHKLGWKPQVSVEHGLGELVARFQGFRPPSFRGRRDSQR